MASVTMTLPYSRAGPAGSSGARNCGQEGVMYRKAIAVVALLATFAALEPAAAQQRARTGVLGCDVRREPVRAGNGARCAQRRTRPARNSGPAGNAANGNRSGSRKGFDEFDRSAGFLRSGAGVPAFICVDRGDPVVSSSAAE